MSDQQGWIAPGAGEPSGNWQPPQAGLDAGLDAELDAGHDQHQSFPANPVPPPTHAAAPPASMPMAGARYEYRPGIIALRPQSMSDIWGGVMTAIRGNPAATIGLSLVTVTTLLVPLTALGVWLGNNLEYPDLPSEFDDALGGIGLGALVAIMVPTFALLVTTWVLPVFMAYVIGQGVQGRKVSMAETWQATRGRFAAAIGLVGLLFVAAIAGVVLMGVIVGVAAAADTAALAVIFVILGIVVMVHLWVRVGFAMSIVTLEQAGPVTALRRSFALTKGTFWRLFGIRLLTAIIVGIAGSIMSNVIGVAGGLVAGSTGTDVLVTTLVVTQAVSILVQTVLTTPFSSGVDSLLYIDQRIRREGLDMQLIQQAQAARAS